MARAFSLTPTFSSISSCNHSRQSKRHCVTIKSMCNRFILGNIILMFEEWCEKTWAVNRIHVRKRSRVRGATSRKVIKLEEVVVDRNKREDKIAALARYDSLLEFISPWMQRQIRGCAIALNMETPTLEQIVLIVLAIVALVAAVAWLSRRRRQRSRTRWITDKLK